MKKPKVGRNDLCPCGNGKKYKKCHGASSAPQQVQSQPERSFSLCVHPANTVPPEVLAKAMALENRTIDAAMRIIRIRSMNELLS